MTLPGPQLLGLIVLVSELGLRLSRRSRAASSDRSDRSSLTLLWLTISLALGAGVLVTRLAPRYNFELPPPLHLAVVAGFGAALLFRWWAVVTLGRFFTVDVAIHHDHRLITAGPYRWLRHPSYTGLLLLFVALAITFGNGLSVVVVLVPITLALLYRIRVEEHALQAAFGPEYEEYRRTTRALIPWVY